ncbi:MAG: hypothetical protein HKN33_01490 [Pyrinomonadaceae bacterium]|nr:hypothetical protein [Pyrinomonadaceae bacterium]
MPFYLQVVLLFTFNFMDAVLTLFWVRNGFATEGNHLMATLLDIGDMPFLLVKLAVGAIAAVVLWKWNHLRLAKYGLLIALFIYTALMGVHFVTGLSAMGFVARETLNDLTIQVAPYLATLA